MAFNTSHVDDDLKARQSLLQTVLDNLPVGVMITDISGKALMFNKALEQIWQGQRPLEHFRNYIEYCAWDTKTNKKVEPDQWPVSLAIQTGQPTEEYELIIERFDKTRGYMLTKAVPIIAENGKVIGAVGVAQDITAVKESEQRFRSVLESSLDVIYRFNLQTGFYEYMSPSIRSLGFEPEEMTSMSDKEVLCRVHPDDLPVLKCELARLAETGRGSAEYRFMGKDGVYRWWSNQMTIIKDQTGRPLYREGDVRDISKRKEIEQALQESEELYRILFENTDDGFVIVQPLFDANGDSNNYINLKVNTAWERQTGLKAADFEGKPIRDVMLNVEPIWPNVYAEVAKTGKSRRFENYNQYSGRWYEVYAFPYKQGQVGVLFRDITERKKAEEALKLSGQRIHEILESITDDFMVLDRNWNYVYANSQAAKLVGLEPKSIVGKNFWALFPQNRGTEIESNLREAMERRETRRFEILGQYSKKSKIITTYPSVEGIALIATDITERKNLENQLHKQERLAAIGATAGMVGHDIRNPLQAMMSDVYLLKELLKTMPSMETKDEVIESLDGLEKNIAYVNKIVADLQDYARPLKPEYSLVDVSQIVSNVLKTVTLQDNIKLIVDVKAPNKIKSEATYIQRSLTNLVNNAIQAMPNGGTLTLNIDKNNDKIIFTVKDTGVGIPEEVKDRIFFPMTTTKSKGQGLGLAVVKRLIEALNGTVSFESKEGQGSTFRIEVPIARP